MKQQGQAMGQSTSILPVALQGLSQVNKSLSQHLQDPLAEDAWH